MNTRHKARLPHFNRIPPSHPSAHPLMEVFSLKLSRPCAWCWLPPTLLGLLVVYAASPLGATLTPFAVGAGLAYIAVPMVDALARRGVGRTWGALLVMLLFMGLVGCLLLLLVPMLVHQAMALSVKLPNVVDWGQHTLLPWLNGSFGLTLSFDAATLKKAIANNLGSLRQLLSQAVPFITDQGAALVGYVSNLFLLPLILFYLLRDWTFFTAPLLNGVPLRWQTETRRIATEIDTLLGHFLRGQLLVMVIMAAVYGGGLWLIGLDSGFAIGVVAGGLVFIPYVGAGIGLLLATLAALLQFGSVVGLAKMLAVFAVGQSLESFFVTPKLVGERIGLHPLVVIFALMAFGQLFGFVGIMLALPASAVLLVLLRVGGKRYAASAFYRRANLPNKPSAD